MALFRLEVKNISRSAGRTATAAAAYRAGELIHDERTGLAFDYRARNYDASGELKAANDREILHTEILAPANAPEEFRDRAKLWNAAELAENRKDARVARELLLALPHELNHKQQVNLVRRFVQERCVDRGMIADIAIHAPDKQGDQRNHHSHILLTTRPVSEEGFASKKDRSWNSKDMLQEWREHWADHQNAEFRRLGLAVMVDHRSYEDQGSLKQPGVHLGPQASSYERSGVETRVGAHNDNVAAKNAIIEPLGDELGKELNVIDRSIEFWEQQKLNEWKAGQKEKLQLDQEKRKAGQEADLQRRLDAMEADLEAEFSDAKEGLAREHDKAKARLEVSGWRKILRDITFITARDKKRAEETDSDRRRIELEEEKRRAQAHSANEGRRAQFKAAMAAEAEKQGKRLEKAEERRAAKNYAAGPGKGVKAVQEALARKEAENNKSPAPDAETSAKKPPVDRGERFKDRRDQARERFGQGGGYKSVADRHNEKKKPPARPKPPIESKQPEKPDFEKLRKDAQKRIEDGQPPQDFDTPEDDL